MEREKDSWSKRILKTAKPPRTLAGATSRVSHNTQECPPFRISGQEKVDERVRRAPEALVMHLRRVILPPPDGCPSGWVYPDNSQPTPEVQASLL